MTAIRQLQEADFPAIITIEQELFVEPWTEDIIRTVLSEPAISASVIVDGDEIIGYLIVQQERDMLHILNIAITKKYQRKGFGGMLLDEAERIARSLALPALALEVRISNTAAIAVYNRRGYSGIHKIYSYYENGEDALFMYKSLI